MRAKKFYAALAVTMALSASAAFGESLWIKSSSAVMHTDKAAIFPAVATLVQGTEVTVISRAGDWVQASSGASQGWIAQASLSTTRVNGEIKLLPGANAEMATGIAARGLQPGAEDYVRTRNIDKRPLESLIAIRKSLPPAEWLAFIVDVHK